MFGRLFATSTNAHANSSGATSRESAGFGTASCCGTREKRGVIKTQAVQPTQGANEANPLALVKTVSDTCKQSVEAAIGTQEASHKEEGEKKEKAAPQHLHLSYSELQALVSYEDRHTPTDDPRKKLEEEVDSGNSDMEEFEKRAKSLHQEMHIYKKGLAKRKNPTEGEKAMIDILGTQMHEVKTHVGHKPSHASSSPSHAMSRGISGWITGESTPGNRRSESQLDMVQHPSQQSGDSPPNRASARTSVSWAVTGTNVSAMSTSAYLRPSLATYNSIPTSVPTSVAEENKQNPRIGHALSSMSSDDLEAYSSDADEDDDDVLDHRYKKRHGIGIEAQVAAIRQKMEWQGIDEPREAVVEKVQTSKVYRLELVFEMKKDDMSPWEMVDVVFDYRPLGMQWDKRAPITINKVLEGSYAQDLGVQKGWRLAEINGTNYKTATYRRVLDDLMKHVNRLPMKKHKDLDPSEKHQQWASWGGRDETRQKKDSSEKPHLHAHGAHGASISQQPMTQIVKVKVVQACGFRDFNADHFCVCEIPGKPHSKVKTTSQCVNDTPETEDLKWNETYELMDFAMGDSIEFSVYESKRGEKSWAGEDNSLGRLRMPFDTFCRSGYTGEFSLIDPRTKHQTATKMKVEVMVEMVPEKQQAIQNFQRIMAERLTSLEAVSTKQDDEFEKARKRAAAAMTGSYTSCSEALKDGLLAYHLQSEAAGKIFPFAGTYENAEAKDLDDKSSRQLQQYCTRLDTSHPERLWPNRKDAEKFGNVASEDQEDEDDVENAESARYQKNISAKSKKTISGPTTNSNIFSVRIVFQVSTKDPNEVKEVEFNVKPLGVVFSQRSPITIAQVKSGSHAEEKGVQKGWKIYKINGNDCSGMKYKDKSKLLYDTLDELPTKS